MPVPASASHPAAAGYTRFTMDIAAEIHARFKSICALHRTTMSAEINSIIAQQLADPDRLLSEALYVRVSPELKQEIMEYATKRRVSLGTLLMEAVAQLERRQEPNAREGRVARLVMNGHAGSSRNGRVHASRKQR